MRTLSSTFNSIQKYLFPVLEEEIGKLTEKQREFVRTIELIEPERFMDSQNWSGFGRPPSKRQNIFKAYIAKSVYNYPTTKVLIEFVWGKFVSVNLTFTFALGFFHNRPLLRFNSKTQNRQPEDKCKVTKVQFYNRSQIF